MSPFGTERTWPGPPRPIRFQTDSGGVSSGSLLHPQANVSNGSNPDLFRGSVSRSNVSASDNSRKRRLCRYPISMRRMSITWATLRSPSAGHAERRLVGGQEQCGRRDLIGLAEPAEQRPISHRAQELLAAPGDGLFQHRRADRSRRDRIRGDAVARILARHALGERDHAALGRGIDRAPSEPTRAASEAMLMMRVERGYRNPSPRAMMPRRISRVPPRIENDGARMIACASTEL